MTFNKLGGIYYSETYEITPSDYGGSIPCFIGRTVNPQGLTPEQKTTENGKRRINKLQKFTNFEQVNKTALDTNGKMLGLGDYATEGENNPLLKAVHDFCEETKLMTEEYVACPYFYVIDLGTAENITDWILSIETSKSKREIDDEIYVGFEKVIDKVVTENEQNTTVYATLENFMLAINYDLVVNRQTVGDFRKAFYTPLTINTTTNKYEKDTYYKENYTTIDTELIRIAKAVTTNNDVNITNNALDTTITTNTIPKSRTYLCEPLNYGKTMGRIITTPYDMEPAYYPYNSLTVDDIILRKPQEQLQLQLNGVIFNHLEETSTEEYIKINRTQAVSSNLVEHPPDSLYQSRHLCDILLTRVFDACYPQLKNKETETNLKYLKTQINKIVNDAIKDGDFIAPYTENNTEKGTFLNVQESSEDAYDLEVVGMIQPVNCTYSIHIVAQINSAKIKVIEE